MVTFKQQLLALRNIRRQRKDDLSSLAMKMYMVLKEHCCSCEGKQAEENTPCKECSIAAVISELEK